MNTGTINFKACGHIQKIKEKIHTGTQIEIFTAAAKRGTLNNANVIQKTTQSCNQKKKSL